MFFLLERVESIDDLYIIVCRMIFFHPFSEDVTTDITRHDDDTVLTIDGATFTVRDATIIEHLEKDSEDIGMCFLYFVKKDDAVGSASDGFGELSSLVVADIAGRRTDELRSAMFFLILGHIDTDHRFLIIEEMGCESFG